MKRQWTGIKFAVYITAEPNNLVFKEYLNGVKMKKNSSGKIGTSYQQA